MTKRPTKQQPTKAPDSDARIAVAENDIRWIKGFIKFGMPAICGFLFACVAIFSGITVYNLREKVDEAMKQAAIASAKQRAEDAATSAQLDARRITEIAHKAEQLTKLIAALKDGVFRVESVDVTGGKNRTLKLMPVSAGICTLSIVSHEGLANDGNIWLDQVRDEKGELWWELHVHNTAATSQDRIAVAHKVSFGISGLEELIQDLDSAIMEIESISR